MTKDCCRNGHPASETTKRPNGKRRCRMCAAAAQLRYWRKHPGRRNAPRASRDPVKRRSWAKLAARRLRKKVIDYLGACCIQCGWTDIRALQIDHIDGGGSQEKLRLHTRGLARKVLSGSPGYQLLCANCNWIKKWERQEVLTADAKSSLS